MNKVEMEKLVKDAYKGYLEMAENENKIVIDLNGFDLLEECKNEEGELDLDLTVELNDMLISLFEENGYTTYKNGEFYAEDGKFVDVYPATVVAIKE